ncbi:MAG: hypothetical protein KDH09_03730 [Chrysiogenetes bacterium]|nr:hypothetical protein [Chrysiogenetes bacterium]
MKSVRSLVLWLSVTITVSACGPSARYTPPSEFSRLPTEIVVHADYDTAWTALIRHVSETFFSIEHFEKDSGLIVLSFAADKPSVYVDCGNYSAARLPFNPSDYSGAYADYATQFMGARLSGRLNINVNRISDDKTGIRVIARYIFGPMQREDFLSAATGQRPSFAFDTGQSDTKLVTDTRGSLSARSCRPTHVAEYSILEAVNKNLEKK